MGGFVTTSRPATVTFRIVDDKGWHSQPVTWTFVQPGRHQLYTWQRRIAPKMGALATKSAQAGAPAPVLTGWYRVELLAPEKREGPRVRYRVTCMAPGKAKVLLPAKPQ